MIGIFGVLDCMWGD